MSRPDNLPDFGRPPLNEVVLGAQFSKPRGYMQILAYKVWELYRAEFPSVEELQPLPPSFETFGLPSPMQFNFNVMTGAKHNRFWFLSPNSDELIQFQDDRLLHNWRKVGDMKNEYPRFERMIERFEGELRIFEKYCASLTPQELNITQCEVSYINHIYADGRNGQMDPGDVFHFAQFPGERPEDFSFNFRRTISGRDGAPIGRIIGELQSAVHSQTGSKIFIFTLTARGAPTNPTVASALEFLKVGREIVVNNFAELTTEAAHKIWGRTI